MTPVKLIPIHFRCNDAATGLATPVRARFSLAGGTTYAPLGRAVDFPAGRNEAVGGRLRLNGERWFYIDGACEIALPAGVPLRVQAAKGPEYRPLDETVMLGSGQMALRVQIARAIDWRGRGYRPGDTRCHFLAPHPGLLETMAEDLDVANALATPVPLLAKDGNTYTLNPDLMAFSGQEPALARPPHLYIVNTLNTHPVLGKVGLLHSHRAVYPLTFGGPDDTDDWSVCDWCDQCHRKGGLTVWVDVFESAGGIVGGEALVAAVLGKIDAIEIDPGPRTSPLLPWLYRLWDAGFRLPIVGASGKDSNRIPLGAMRTYAHLVGDMSPRAWIEAVRTGHTFASSGPVIDFQANGTRPGDAVDVGDSQSVAIDVRAESLLAFERLEVVGGSGVVVSAAAVASLESSLWSAEIHEPYSPPESGWIAARCVGINGFAHTSPIAVRMGGRPLPRSQRAAVALSELVRQTREWTETQGRYANTKRRDQLLGRCDDALGKLASG